MDGDPKLNFFKLKPVSQTDFHHWSFYLDWASYLLYTVFDLECGLVVLTSMLEIASDSVDLLRIVAYILESLFDHPRYCLLLTKNHSVMLSLLYDRIFEMRPEEPISLRDLSNFLIGTLDKNADLATILKVTDLNKRILETDWDRRFKTNQIEVISLGEINSLIAQYENVMIGENNVVASIKHSLLSNNRHVAPLLACSLPVELRITAEWTSGEAEVELHITEPTGEVCNSMKKLSSNGGFLSCDCVGYGPLEYSCRRALTGIYTVSLKLFSNKNKHSPVVVKIEIRLNLSNREISKQTTSTILYQEKETQLVAEIQVAL